MGNEDFGFLNTFSDSQILDCLIDVKDPYCNPDAMNGLGFADAVERQCVVRGIYCETQEEYAV